MIVFEEKFRVNQFITQFRVENGSLFDMIGVR
jgi:hypothetical protein